MRCCEAADPVVVALESALLLQSALWLAHVHTDRTIHTPQEKELPTGFIRLCQAV